MTLRKDIDYYINKDGLYVFTELYLKERGYCCENGCRHCPYGFDKTRIDNQEQQTHDEEE